MGDVWDAIQRPKSLVVGDGCVWDGHSFFFKFMHSNRMQGMQQRYKHRGGCVGVVRRNRNHYGVGWGRILGRERGYWGGDLQKPEKHMIPARGPRTMILYKLCYEILALQSRYLG